VQEHEQAEQGNNRETAGKKQGKAGKLRRARHGTVLIISKVQDKAVMPGIGRLLF
jgi:hypothetical protein